MMRIKETIQAFSLLSILGIIYASFLSCTGHGQQTREVAAQSSVNVRMAAEPSALYKDFKVQVKEIKLATQDGKDFRTLKVDQPLILHSQSGHEATAELLKGQNLPPKDYRLVSIVLDPRTEKNSVTLASGLPRPLIVPDGITVQLEGLPQGTKTYEIRIVLDTDRSIQRTRIDGSEGQDSFTLRPCLRAVDASSTGSSKGKASNSSFQRANTRSVPPG